MVRIWVLRGGLWGPDGPITSPGMDALARQIATATGITPRVFNWSSWQTVAGEIAANLLGKTVVIGYSGGGTRAIYVANQVAPVRIDLLVLYDPSPVWQMQDIGPNVIKAICYYNTAPWMGSLGGGRLQGPQVIEVPVAEQHLLVQNDQRLHAMTISQIKDMAGLT